MNTINNICYFFRGLFDVVLLILIPLFVLNLPILLSVWVGNALWMIGLLISWLPAFWVFEMIRNVYNLTDL